MPVPEADIPNDIGTWKRDAAVLHLTKYTLDAAVIAEIIGTSPGVVRSQMTALRRDGFDVPRLTARRSSLDAPMAVKAELPPSLIDRLRTAAQARHERPQETAKRILTAVLQHNLIDAVLDEEK